MDTKNKQLGHVLLNFTASPPKTAHPQPLPWCSAWHSGQLMFIPHAAGVLTSAIWQTPSKLSCDIYPAVACVQPLYTLREWWMECCSEGSHSHTCRQPHLHSCFYGLALKAPSNCDKHDTNCQPILSVDVQYFPQIIFTKKWKSWSFDRFDKHSNKKMPCPSLMPQRGNFCYVPYYYYSQNIHMNI